MRLSIEEKQSLVARYHAGESVAEICADVGVARSTFYTWLKEALIKAGKSQANRRR